MIIPVSFDEANHAYTVNGVRVPSVTQIIREVFQLQGWGYNQDAADRGEAVHKLCQLISEGDHGLLESDRVHPELRGYGRAWYNCCLELEYVSHWWEKPLASKLGYAGRLDTGGVMGSSHIPTLGDVKSGQRPIWVGVQLGLYDYLYRENFPDAPRMQRRAFQLEKDGSYTCHSGVNVPGRGWIDFDNSYWDVLAMSAINIHKSCLMKTNWADWKES